MLREWIYTNRRLKGIKQEDLAKTLGLSKQSISSWERGRGKPVEKDLLRLEEIFGCKYIGEVQPVMINPEEIMLEIRGKIAATPFRLAQLANSGKYVKGKAGENGCYALEIDGDSMEPAYLHGDIIVCRPQVGIKINPFISESDDDASYIPRDRIQHLHNIDAVVLHNDESSMKRIRISKKSGPFYDLELVSLNPKYPAVKLRRGDDFEVQALVVRHTDRPVPQL